MSELLLWKGRPSQWLNFGVFFICIPLSFLGIPLLYALWKYLIIRTLSFEISNEIVRIKRGVFSIEVEVLELYRVKDLRLLQPFLLRLLGLSTIILITSDKSTPVVEIPAISNGDSLIEKLRKAVEKRRDEKGVKERDFE